MFFFEQSTEPRVRTKLTARIAEGNQSAAFANANRTGAATVCQSLPRMMIDTVNDPALKATLS